MTYLLLSNMYKKFTITKFIVFAISLNNQGRYFVFIHANILFILFFQVINFLSKGYYDLL